MRWKESSRERKCFTANLLRKKWTVRDVSCMSGMARKDGFWVMKRMLTFDFTNVTDNSVSGNGIPDALLDALRDPAGSIHSNMMERRNTGALPYMDLPYADNSGIVRYAEEAKGRFENFVNVGIGGSALGAQALFLALRHPFHNLLGNQSRAGMRMFFADNIDRSSTQPG